MTVDNSDLNFGETLDVLVRIVDDAIEEQEYRQYVSNLEGYELDEGDEELIDGTAFSGGESKNGPKPVGVLAVVGRPNVGKSTLVNRILGRRAAVVEDTPGVTRDRVSYDAEWCGTDFKLVDTGGWEADVEGIESAIASQAQIAVQLADAVILVVDGLVGCSSIPQVSNVVCTSCPARNTSPRCVRRPRSNVPSLPWCCSMPPSRFPTKT